MSFFETVALSLNMAISLSSLATFLIYMLVGSALFALHVKMYTLITPHNEFELIRNANPSASVALIGACIGFAIPMAGVISHSIGLLDFIVWAVIASCVQLLVFYVASKVVKGLSDRIVNNEMSAAVFVAGLAISVGLINAACMTPDDRQNAQAPTVITVQESEVQAQESVVVAQDPVAAVPQAPAPAAAAAAQEPVVPAPETAVEVQEPVAAKQ
jgi:putative membrane protein